MSSKNNELLDHFNNIMSSIFIFGSLFFVLTINFSALSLSLHLNRNSPIHIKIGNAIYAFLFGLIYILLNYYFYRVLKKGKPASTYGTQKLFPLN